MLPMTMTMTLALATIGADRPPGETASMTAAKRTALQAVDEQAPRIESLGQEVWRHAELAFREFESSKLLADTLEENGFRVRRGVAGMRTAFVAEYGEGKPVLALLAEFDALPGLSQAASPVRAPRARGAAGHGCGHNLFGAASVGAALALKKAIDSHELAGTIRLYGCPAEEGGGGKTYLVREGLFDDVDAALHWHPGTTNDARMRSCLAVIRFRVDFKGKAAHAAGSPHKGRSAMDGIELMNIGVNFLREHVIADARMHYIVTNGGLRPNVVPEHAQAWYYIRAPKMPQAQAIFERVKKIAQGAALMSETEQRIHSVTGTYELLVNRALAERMDANLRLIGPPRFTPEEKRFASELRATLGIAADEDLRSGAKGPVSDIVVPFGTATGKGSTDVGDVSWNVPTVGLGIATAARGIPGHSWSFVACSGSPMGTRGSVTAAKVLAATAVDLLERPEIIAAAEKEFEQRKGKRRYEGANGTEPPPDRLDE